MLKSKMFYKVCLAVLFGTWITIFFTSIIAAPQGGEVKSGDITITTDKANNVDTLIVQKTDKGIIDWQSFSIGATEHTHFAQPGVTAITLNRVIGGDLSSILGQLTATGQIWLLNPAGVFFGPNARVDVAGLVASTANITNENFLSGNYRFLQGPNGNIKIVNQGYINAANKGLVFLISPRVENLGVIEATLGKVVLGSSPANSSYALDFYGDRLIQFAIPSDVGASLDTAIVQSGRITAPGGKVLLAANTAKSVVDQAINMSGIIEADTIFSQGGSIILSGGEKGVVAVTGKILARGENPGESGGTVKIQGEKVGLFDNAMVDVSGMAGGGNVLIGADFIDGSVVPVAKATYVGPDVNIMADATKYGKGGSIWVWSDQATRFYGTASAKGGPDGGNGGFVETSSKNWLDVSGAFVDVSAAFGKVGTWLLDPFNVTIVSGSPPPAENGTWTNTSDPYIWAADADVSILYADSIVAALNAASVNVTTNGSINLSSNSNIDYAGTTDRTLTLYTTSNAGSPADINIQSAITGQHLDLVLYTGAGVGGKIYIGANIGTDTIPVRSLATYGGEVHIQNVGTVINTVSSQSYSSAVILEANTRLAAAGAGITFSGPVSTTGNHNLTINAGGTVLFNGAVGGSGTSAFNVLSITTTGGGNVTFASAIDGGADLTITSAGDITFGGGVGVTAKLNSLDVTSAGNTNINTNTVNTVGAQTYSGNVVLGGSSPTTFSATNNQIQFTGNLTGASQNVNLQSGTGDIRLAAVNNIGDLQLQGTGTTALNGDINNTESINTATSGTTEIRASSITTANDQSYNNAVKILANTSLATTGSGNVLLASTVDGGGGLNVSSNGTATFNGAVGSTNGLGFLNVASAGNTNINTATINTAGNQTYSGNVVLGTNTALIAASGDVVFGQKVDSQAGQGYGLDVNASTGNVAFDGVVGLSGLDTMLGYLKVAAGGVINLIGSGIKTIGDQWYKNAVTLGANNVLTTTDTGNVKFDSTVNGAYSLAINSGKDVTFNNTVGAGAALSSLDVASAGNTNIDASAIITTGGQEYRGPVILGTNAALTGGGPNAIQFLSTVDSADNGIGGSKGYGLTVNKAGSGNVAFEKEVGAKNALGYLSVTSPSGVALNGSVVTTDVTVVDDVPTTSGNQVYNGPVVLGANNTLTTGGGNVTFTNTVDSRANKGYSLNVSAGSSGVTTFNGAVGGAGMNPTSALGALTVNSGGGINLGGPGVKTIGNQTYQGAVTLGADNLLMGSNVYFDSALDGGFGLTIDAGGEVVFRGAVGLVSPLRMLDVTAPNRIYLASPYMETTGYQIYQSPVVLGSDLVTLKGSAVNFMNTVNSDAAAGVSLYRSLAINALSTVFNDVVGGIPLQDFDKSLGTVLGFPLRNLTVSGGDVLFPGAGVTTIGNQQYDSEVKLFRNVAFTAGSPVVGSTGNITFGSKVAGPYNLILSSNGDIVFAGDVGSYGHSMGAVYIDKGAHDVTVAPGHSVYANAFVQLLGRGTTSIGIVGDPTSPPVGGQLYVGPGTTDIDPLTGKPVVIHSTDPKNEAYIVNSVIKVMIDAGLLTVGTPVEAIGAVQLGGFVGGLSSEAALKNIYVAEGYYIREYGSYSFNRIDLRGVLTRAINETLVDSILKDLLDNYAFGFGISNDKGNADYLLLLDDASDCSAE